MLLIEGTTDFQLDGPSAVAIGKFDGIHRGHQELLKKIKETGFQTVIFTFDPPPNVLFGQTEVRGLTTREEKRRIFDKQGIDVLIEYPLNEKTAATDPEDFIEEILVKRLRTAYIAAGTDLSFGSRGRGNSALLEKWADTYGYQVEIIDKILDEGEEITSTRIREEVKQGHMQTVTRLIGFPYSITGIVEHGKRIGRTIGIPTVNLLPPDDKLLPPHGVYYSYVSYNGKHYRSISNVGVKPTVGDRNVQGVESYLYDFDEEIYGKKLTVNLLEFRRPEEKFPSVEVLKARMQEDVAAGAQYPQMF